MKKKPYLFLLLLFIAFNASAQDSLPAKKWLRIGFIYGYSAQNKFIKQEYDYFYESKIFKISNHFMLRNRPNYNLELLIEPSYYRSKHQMLNYWFISHTVENGDELRAKYMKMKDINEYVLNVGLMYRRKLSDKHSLYAYLNSGPMYIDTETERLKKGFAFSDIFALGYNYKINKISFDIKGTYRHVSNANIQKPNFGYNAYGFEVGTYYEFN